MLSGGAFDESMFQHETAVVARVADIYPRCYYAWNYRIWLVDALSNAAVAANDWRSPWTVLSRELLENACWLRRHIGDGSAYNHRRFLLTRLLALVASSSVITNELLSCELAFTSHMLL
jgi:hypothetical protein